jgi:hypothetical protein
MDPHLKRVIIVLAAIAGMAIYIWTASALERRRHHKESTMSTTEITCDCSDDYGPCEQHGTVVVQREGASLRTADDLLLLFCEDADAVLWERTGEPRISPWGRAVIAQSERALNANDPGNGCRWFSPEDERLRDDLVTLQSQLESELASLDQPINVVWEDGYVFYEVADSCPLLV